ncbi:MAG: zinc-ribbon domain-containing protein, partial [Proteobacteria bacterium]|nr:zinc-ribbon domain-containing protein [Pseudomonadota bacterium]
MIVTCNECNTHFNVDEHLLKQTGSKVRCSKCKNVFSAYPSSLSEEPDKASEVTPETEVEAVVSDEESESGEQYKVEEADMAPQEIDLSDIDNSLEIDEDLNAEKEPEEPYLELDLDL